MKREKGFRVWMKDRESWAYFTIKRLARDPKMQHYVVEADGVYEATGLKDKNGKEIYVMDVMENDDYLGVVVWDSDEARFILQSFSDGSGAMIAGVKIYSPITGEIIGDICRNPELISNHK